MPRRRVLAAILLALATSACESLFPIHEDGSGGAASCGSFAHPAVSSFSDDFDSGFNSSSWFTDCQPDVQNGELVATPPSNSAEPGSCFYSTNAFYHLTCDSLTIKVTGVAAAQTGVQTVVYLRQSDVDAEFVELVLEGEKWSLITNKNATGIPVSRSYDRDLDVWWRLREDSGRLSFWTSPDGSTQWSRLAEGADLAPLDAVQVQLGAGTYQPVAKPGRATFDCYNVSAPCP